MAKLVYRWGRKRYKKKREKRWEENWNRQKSSLGQGTLKEELYYKLAPKKKNICMFINLIENLQKYNTKKI